jgi:hypothetical protein
MSSSAQHTHIRQRLHADIVRRQRMGAILGDRKRSSRRRIRRSCERRQRDDGARGRGRKVPRYWRCARSCQDLGHHRILLEFRPEITNNHNRT